MNAVVPLVLILLALPAAPVAAAPVSGIDATAAGTVSLRLVDPWTGEVLCAAQAAVALEAGSTAGVFTWRATGCGDEGTGAAVFTLQCSDACFPACHLPSFWGPDDVRCTRETGPLGEPWTDDLTLARDGTLAFTRDVWTSGSPYRIEARGVVVIISWPSA